MILRFAQRLVMRNLHETSSNFIPILKITRDELPME